MEGTGGIPKWKQDMMAAKEKAAKEEAEKEAAEMAKMPEWKRKILEEKKRKEQEEDEKKKAVPGWKQKVLEEKAKKEAEELQNASISSRKMNALTDAIDTLNRNHSKPIRPNVIGMFGDASKSPTRGHSRSTSNASATSTGSGGAASGEEGSAATSTTPARAPAAGGGAAALLSPGDASAAVASGGGAGKEGSVKRSVSWQSDERLCDVMPTTYYTDSEEEIDPDDNAFTRALKGESAMGDALRNRNAATDEEAKVAEDPSDVDDDLAAMLM